MLDVRIRYMLLYVYIYTLHVYTCTYIPTGSPTCGTNSFLSAQMARSCARSGSSSRSAAMPDIGIVGD